MSSNDSLLPLPDPSVPREPQWYPEEPGGVNLTPQTAASTSDPGQADPVGHTPLSSVGDDLPGLAAGVRGRRDSGRRPGKRLVLPADKLPALTPQQRLLLLDTWQRSGLPARDFAALVGVSRHTLYAWKKRFDSHGPAGLLDQPKGAPKGSHLPDLTKRTILLLKQSNPDWGCQKISDLLLPSWMIIAVSSSATACMPASRRPWFWKCYGRP